MTDKLNPHYDVVIVGAGQAGLAVGHHLARRGLRFAILEARQRVGDQWRNQWHSLRLFTPARVDSLPGMRFPAAPFHFPTKDEMADYLELYTREMKLPVHTGVRVAGISARDGSGQGYVIDTDRGRIEADQVMVAVNWQRIPRIPSFAAALDPAIKQLHSSEYRSPDQLRPGSVLVVGASHSGADIALEVAAGHETWLVGPHRGEIPFDIEGRAARVLIPLLWFVGTHVLSLSTPIGRKIALEVRSHGGPLLRVKRAHLVSAGVHRRETRVTGVEGGLPRLEDGQVIDVANVVWCTGFAPDFSFIHLPVTDAEGWPLSDRGVVPSAPGLYFAGLAFQRAFTSMLVGGAGRDAGYLARRVVTAQAERRRRREDESRSATRAARGT